MHAHDVNNFRVQGSAFDYRPDLGTSSELICWRCAAVYSGNATCGNGTGRLFAAVALYHGQLAAADVLRVLYPTKLRLFLLGSQYGQTLGCRHFAIGPSGSRTCGCACFQAASAAFSALAIINSRHMSVSTVNLTLQTLCATLRVTTSSHKDILLQIYNNTTSNSQITLAGLIIACLLGMVMVIVYWFVSLAVLIRSVFSCKSFPRRW